MNVEVHSLKEPLFVNAQIKLMGCSQAKGIPGVIIQDPLYRWHPTDRSVRKYPHGRLAATAESPLLTPSCQFFGIRLLSVQ